MIVPPIVQTLPFVAWMLLVTLAFGTFLFGAVTAEAAPATRGYLRFTAITAAILALLAWVVDTSLPAPAGDLVLRQAPADLDLVRRVALGGFAITSLLYAAVLSDRENRWALGGLSLIAAGTALIAAAFSWAPTAVDGVPLAVQLFTLAVTTGGSLAAIGLGHWYLVTPKLSERPLILQTRWLLGALIIQGLLFIVWTTLGGGVGQDAWEALSGSSALLVWLRGLVTVGFPIVLVYMSLRTAQTRSMESATGLLYISLAAVMAGTIGAAALYISGGILV
ncbi:MAG TPA: hypothetical protein VMZ33_03225 [Candidatus Limnocylindrales bacterium]|nr:hypothetical protein [Candidatus Limnocylindrales bacterium]